jgi:atypical dual specificity phosphatase
MTTTYGPSQLAMPSSSEPQMFPKFLHLLSRLLPFNAICSRPIPNSYWATPLLLACEYPWCPGPFVARQKIDALLAAGVRTFIDLTEVDELVSYSSYLTKRAKIMGLDDIEYHRFPIPDRSLPASVQYMREILVVLQDNKRRGRISAVHCR